MMVVKNTLARRATQESALKGFDKLLSGPSAVIYGKQSVPTIARAILDEKKADETIELRGVFFDGEVYVGDAGVQRVSKMPTREEAIGLVVGAILGPGSNLAGALKGPGGTLGAILKTVENNAKEKEGGAAAAPAA
jgi:large subunit ribosomal protein L10